MEEIKKTRVNGSTLGNFINQPVIVLGEYMKGSGSEIEIKCVDNQVVRVNFRNTMYNNSHQGWVEIWGISKNKTQVDCESYIELPSEFMRSFDSSDYNELCKLLVANS